MSGLLWLRKLALGCFWKSSIRNQVSNRVFWTYPWPGKKTMLSNFFEKQASYDYSWSHPYLMKSAENSQMRCISFVWSIDSGNCSFIIDYSKCTFSFIPNYEVKLSEVLCWIQIIWSVMLNLCFLQPKLSKCSVNSRNFWEERTAVFHSFKWLFFCGYQKNWIRPSTMGWSTMGKHYEHEVLLWSYYVPGSDLRNEVVSWTSRMPS